MNFAIIVAAGKSRRMAGINKIFCEINGKPLIFYTISAFENHPKIKKIILVARKNDFEKFSALIRKYNLKKVSSIVEGGKKRQDSSFKGLKMAEKMGAEAGDLILFHNGANPLVSKEEISRTIEAAKKYGAALTGQMAKDTIKEIDKNGIIVKTLNRKKIFLAQTPQAIEYELAKKVFDKAKREKFYGTDEASLVEKAGRKVKIAPGSYKNIKVTYPEDLKIIRVLLSQ